MEPFDILIAVVAVVLVVVATARREPHVKAALTPRTLWLVTLYLVYCLIVVLIVYPALRDTSAGVLKVAAGSAFIVAGMGFGLVWLIRYVPAFDQAPELLRRPFGPLGLGFLVVGLGASIALLL